MEWFFALEGQAPERLWAPIGGAAHLGWLCAALLGCLAAARLFWRLDARARRAMLRACAWTAVGGEAVRDLLLAANGLFDPSYMLPLHLCGAMLFVELAAAHTRRGFLCELSYCLGLPGALAALLTPGLTQSPPWSLCYLQFILAHTLLFLTPVLLLLDGFRPDYRRLPRCFLALLAYAAFARACNRLLGGNYLFLEAPSPGSALALIRRAAGPLYLPALACFVWLCWLALYLPWVRRAGKKPLRS